MPGATMTTVDAILKEVYEGRINNQLQDEVVTSKRIERTSEGIVSTVGGKYVDFPIRVKRNTGLGYRQENELLPAAGQQGYAEVHVPLRYGYARGRITAQAMRLADGNPQAFASALDDEMDRIKDDAAKDENRIYYNDGSGLLASVTADGANTVTVDNIQWLEEGMLIDIRTRANGAAVAAAREITAINETTNVVTYTGADVVATVAEGLYREGNYAAGTAREPTGFGAIVHDTKVLHTVDPALQPKWKALRVANGGVARALSEGLMIQTCDAVRRKGGKITAIFTSLGVRRSYFNLLTQQRRYTDPKNFVGGLTGLAFHYGTEVPVVEEVDAPPNKMWFMNEGELKIYRDEDWHFINEDGSTMKWVRDYDVFEFVMRKYWELATKRRNSHAVLEDITEG